MNGVKIAQHRKSPVYKERIKNLPVVFWMTHEYYNSQIEYNIWRDSQKCHKIKKFYNWLDKHKIEYLLTDNSPSYVGTHIHFLLAKWDEPINFRLRRKKYQVYLSLLKYYNRTYKEILKNKSLKKNYKFSCIKDIERLVVNHNINIYRDSKFFDGQLDRIRKKITWLKYYYINWKNKPKYQPMLWANQRSGKPLTFEVRAIPNTLALDIKKLREIIREIKKAFNTKKSKIIKIKSEIVSERTDLCNLWREMADKDSWGKHVSLKEFRELIK